MLDGSAKVNPLGTYFNELSQNLVLRSVAIVSKILLNCCSKKVSNSVQANMGLSFPETVLNPLILRLDFFLEELVAK